VKEGSLEAPIRHPVPWEDPDYYDEEKLEAETRRVFDICHGCRRCHNLCDSFPRLFDLIDESESGELDTVASEGFVKVVDACTLCDMCFMAKCPYVPPHEFNLDFPQLMLRHRAVAHRKGQTSRAVRRLIATDRNGRLGSAVSAMANRLARPGDGIGRRVMEKAMDIHRQAALPSFARRTLMRSASEGLPPLNPEGPGHGRRVALFATCFGNFHEPQIGKAALAVLAHNGVEARTVYSQCCGMPQLENGDIASVASRARQLSETLLPLVDEGWELVALVPSCALMMKFQWPQLLPENEEVSRLSKACQDLSQYLVELARPSGLAAGMQPLSGKVFMHIACHSRAQNMGRKGVELLKLVPELELTVSERCSGHGGAWGTRRENFPVALKQARPVARQAQAAAPDYISSECPLASLHLSQSLSLLDEDSTATAAAPPERLSHPVELLARAYGWPEAAAAADGGES